MGGFFISYNNMATSTSPMTAAKLIGASGKRYEIIEIIATGAGRANPADIQHELWASFLSNAGAGTGSSWGPVKKDQAGGASQITAAVEYTGEPTTYATSQDTLFSFNQRGGMRWAVPEGYGFKTDGGQTNLSFGIRVISSSVGAVDGGLHWIEP